MYKRILIATDGSALSDKAVEHGLKLAQALNTQVVVMTAVPRYKPAYYEGSLVITEPDIRKIEKEWVRQGQALLSSVIEMASQKGLKAKSAVMKSDLIAEAIIAAARKHQCDLVVMASHGRKGLSRVLLGSETHAVLTHSHIPVLVLR